MGRSKDRGGTRSGAPHGSAPDDSGAPESDDRDGRRPYHHGNLREALLKAAVALIGEKGPAGFTFAEAARWAGVSAAAPYRHFRDRDALLADVAVRGFTQLTDQLEGAWQGGTPEPITALERVGRAYLAFARAEPALYAAMFEAQLPSDQSPALRSAREEAFAVLRRAGEDVAARVPPARRPPGLMVGLHLWSLAHGIAALFARGDGARQTLPMEPEALLEAALLVYLQGLGLYD